MTNKVFALHVVRVQKTYQNKHWHLLALLTSSITEKLNIVYVLFLQPVNHQNQMFNQWLDVTGHNEFRVPDSTYAFCISRILSVVFLRLYSVLYNITNYKVFFYFTVCSSNFLSIFKRKKQLSSFSDLFLWSCLFQAGNATWMSQKSQCLNPSLTAPTLAGINERVCQPNDDIGLVLMCCCMNLQQNLDFI